MANSQFIKTKILADNSLEDQRVSLPVGATETVLLEVRTTNVISQGVEYEPATVQAYYQVEGADSIIIVPQLLRRVEAIPADPDNGIEAEYVFNAIINPTVLNSASGKKLYIRFEVADRNGLKLNKTEFLSVSIIAGTSEAQVVDQTLGKQLRADLDRVRIVVGKDGEKVVPKDLKNASDIQDIGLPTDKFIFYGQEDDGSFRKLTWSTLIGQVQGNDKGTFPDAESVMTAFKPNVDVEQRAGIFAIVVSPSRFTDPLSNIVLETTVQNERVIWDVSVGSMIATGTSATQDLTVIEADINNLKSRADDLEDKTVYVSTDLDNQITTMNSQLEVLGNITGRNLTGDNLILGPNGTIALVDPDSNQVIVKAGLGTDGSQRILVNDIVLLNQNDGNEIITALNAIITNIQELTTRTVDLDAEKLESLAIVQFGTVVAEASRLSLDNTFTVSTGANNTANISVNTNALNIQQNTSQITAANSVLEGGINQQVINQRHELASKKLDIANQPEGMVILDSNGEIPESLLPTGFNVLLDYFRITQNGQTTGDITNSPSTTVGFQLPWTATTSMTQFAMFNEDLTASAGTVLTTEDFTEINIPIFELEQDRQYIVEAEAFVKRGQTTTSIFKGQRAIDGVIDDTIDIITPSTLTGPLEILENDELEWQFRIQVDQGTETGYILVYDQFNPMTVRYNFSAGVVSNANQVLTTIRGESLNQQLFNERVDQEINYQTALNDTNADLYFNYKDQALRQGHHLFLKVPETLNQPLAQIRISIDNGQTYVGLFQHDATEQEFPVYGFELLGDHIQIVYDADVPEGARWELINSDSDRLTNIRFQDETTRYIAPTRRVAGSNDFEIDSIKLLRNGRIYLVDLPEILEGGGEPHFRTRSDQNYEPIVNGLNIPLTEAERLREGAQCELEFINDTYVYSRGNQVSTNIEILRDQQISIANTLGQVSGTVAELDASKLAVKNTDGIDSSRLELTPQNLTLNLSEISTASILLPRPYDAIELCENVPTRGIALDANTSIIYELAVAKSGNVVDGITETGRTINLSRDHGFGPRTIFGLLSDPTCTNIALREDFEIPFNNRVYNGVIDYTDFSVSSFDTVRFDGTLSLRALEWANPYELFYTTLQGELAILDTRQTDQNIAPYTVPNNSQSQAVLVGRLPNTANFAVRQNNGTYTFYVQPQDDASRIIEYVWDRQNNGALRIEGNIPKGAQFPDGAFIRMYYDKTADLALQYAAESRTLFTGTVVASAEERFNFLNEKNTPFISKSITLVSEITGNRVECEIPDEFDSPQDFVNLIVENFLKFQIVIGNSVDNNNAVLVLKKGNQEIEFGFFTPGGTRYTTANLALSVVNGSIENGFTVYDRSEFAVPSDVGPTGNSLMLRDVDGRAQITTPTTDLEIANKFYVDNATSNRDSITDQNSKEQYQFYINNADEDLPANLDPLTIYFIEQP